MNESSFQAEGTVLDDTMLDTVADILITLSDVGQGDYSARLARSFPSDHPLDTLLVGINEMIGSLQDAQKATEGYQKELEEKVAMIEAQRLAIRELSTPILEVWDGVLCLPVVGVLDTTRSAQMTESLLSAIVEKEATYAIVDITGIDVMDTGTADHFLRMARAIRLLGAECLLTGISPTIAQTIIHMGVDLAGIRPHSTLRTGLQEVIERHAPSVR